MMKLIFFILTIMTTTILGNELAIETICKFEGFVETVYKDVNQQAIGYGTELKQARVFGFKGIKITKEQARKLVSSKIEEDKVFIRKKIKNFDNLDVNVRASLLSACYNSRKLIGPKLSSYINNKQYRKACVEIAYGHNPKGRFGLVNRRFEESKMMFDGFNVVGNFLYRPVNMKEFNKNKEILCL